MRKIVAFCCSLFILSFPAQAQLGHEWINFGQNYYKIPVAKDGIYRLSYLDLQNAGFPVGSVDPKTFQIFHRGVEYAIYVEGEDDTQFNPSDFIEFYGQKNDGTLDAELYQPTSAQPHPYYNLYTDTTSYFLTFGALSGQRMAVVDESNSSGQARETFHTDRNLLVLTQQYSPGFTTDDILNTFFDQGEGWTGAQVVQNQTIDYTMSNVLQGSATNGLPELELVLVGRWIVQNTAEIYVGPSTGALRLLSSVTLNGYESKKFLQEIQWADIGSDGKLVVRVRAAGTNARLSASYVLLRYPQNTDMMGAGEKVFRLQPNANDISYIEIANPGADARLFDITDPSRVKRIITTASTTLNAMVTSTAVPRTLLASNATLKPPIKRARFRPITPAQHDYIIISHKWLMRSAAGSANPVKEYGAYRASAAGGGYDTLVVDMGLLYDQFSYGEQTPVAIFHFMKFLVQSHMPKYLFIIGKGLTVNQGYYRNPAPFLLYKDFVPAAGIPGSDIAFTAGLAGTSYDPAVPTGRITASSPDDVMAYLNKVKEMDALPYNDLWRKNLLHLSGGIEEGEPEYFKSLLEDFATVARGYHLGGAVSARAKRSREIEQNIDVSAEVNKGVSLVTFFGHSSASTLDFDVGFVTNPVLGYNNKGKYPMFLINGCNAGSFFLYNKLFGEDWILAPNKGAVGFIAHTYYGLVSTLQAYTSVFYDVGYRDSTFITQGIGDIHKETARRYLASNGVSIYNSTLAQQMMLLGDPAVKLFGAPKADYEINDDNLSVHSFTDAPVTAESDSFALKIIVRNFGQAKEDTFRIEVQRRYNDNTVVTYDSLFTPVLYSDTLMFVIRKDRNAASGNNTFTVTIDPDEVVKELDETNNTASIGFAIPLNGTRNLFPYKYAIVSNRQVNLSLQSTDLLSGERDFLIEVDTTDQFNSEFKKVFTLKAKVFARQSISLLDDDSLTYYWRTKLAVPQPGESEEWTASSFSYIAESPEGWAQIHFPQYQENPSTGLVKDPELRRLEFPETVTDVSIRTFGSNKPFVITDVHVRIAGAEYNLNTQGLICRNNTINLIAFDRRSAIPYIGIPFKWYNRVGRACGREPWVINSFSPPEMITGKGDDITAYVNNIALGDSVVLYSVGYAGYPSWPSAAKIKLGELGISLAQINALEADEPVVIFARKGLAPGQATVIRAPAPASQQELLVNKTITGRYTSGEMTSVSIGPAARWIKLASRTHGATANDLADIEIIGVKLNGAETSLATGVSGDHDLSSIDAGEYPMLKLRYTATDDVDLTPMQLNKWLVLYEPVAEGMLVYAGSPEQQAVTEGVSWTGPYGFINISEKTFTDSLQVDLDVFNTPARFSQNSSFKIKAPAPGDTTWFNVNVPTTGKTGLNDVSVFVNRRILPEQYYDNNVLELYNYLNVQSDPFNPVLEVTIDGRYVVNGDFVSPSPSIRARLWDDNRILLKQDTAGVVLLLSAPCEEECDMRRIYFSSPGVSWSPATDTSDFTVVYKPTNLAEGKYLLQVSAADVRGNSSGEVDYEVTFYVSQERSVLILSPFPNPLQWNTLFRIVVSGTDEPEAASIRFTTVSGIPVQDISNTLHIGTNEIHWSGTDASGNLLPPGLYIYRVQLSVGGEAYDKIGKVVIVR
jgi:hypothetical protein